MKIHANLLLANAKKCLQLKYLNNRSNWCGANSPRGQQFEAVVVISLYSLCMLWIIIIFTNCGVMPGERELVFEDSEGS